MKVLKRTSYITFSSIKLSRLFLKGCQTSLKNNNYSSKLMKLFFSEFFFTKIELDNVNTIYKSIDNTAKYDKRIIYLDWEG